MLSLFSPCPTYFCLFLSADSSNVLFERRPVSIVSRYRLVRESLGCIVRTFTHLQAKQSIYNACHGPRNRCTSEINSIPYDDADVRKDFYQRALFPLLG